MSSILTNTSAMTALQTLKATNANLAKTQSEISTGKTVASAQDNASTWAISKVMESDVKAFETVQNQLSLAESTVNVAKTGAEQITDILKDIKGKVVEATNPSNDIAKINADVTAMKDQITSIISSAQFNGVNLLNTAGGNQQFISSLDRDAAGAVTPVYQTVNSVDFEGTIDLTTIDLTDSTTAQNTLDTVIDGIITTAVDGAAALGSSLNRITSQSDYVSKLTDSMKTGIGSLVDADMEEASSRLQALQTQQQLGIQALSIANQAPQNVLSLFR